MEAFKIYGNLRWIVSSIKHNGWRKSYNFECWRSQVRTNVLFTIILYLFKYEHVFVYVSILYALDFVSNKIDGCTFKLRSPNSRVFVPFVFNVDFLHILWDFNSLSFLLLWFSIFNGSFRIFLPNKPQLPKAWINWNQLW